MKKIHEIIAFFYRLKWIDPLRRIRQILKPIYKFQKPIGQEWLINTTTAHKS